MVYHVVNKSISDFTIFNNEAEFNRMLLTIRYYQVEKQPVNLSRYIRSSKSGTRAGRTKIALSDASPRQNLVEIIAYCIMPTHLHLLLEELGKDRMSKFINDILNSYTRYFNIKHNRKGPLWEGPSKQILIDTDEQLIHVTRYIHLNPTTAYIVDKPEKWPWSSYAEYLGWASNSERICKYEGILNIIPDEYKIFSEAGIAYQRELAAAKSLALD